MVVKESRGKTFFLEMGVRVRERWAGGGGRGRVFKTKEVKRVMVYAFFL